jgi:hypothetical protein
MPPAGEGQEEGSNPRRATINTAAATSLGTSTSAATATTAAESIISSGQQLERSCNDVHPDE